MFFRQIKKKLNQLTENSLLCKNKHMKNKKGIPRLINATRCSIIGLKAVWKSEEAFKIECILAFFMIPAGIWFGETAVQQSLLVGTCLLVLITELLNTGIETVVDRIGLEEHELSGKAKDAGSAAVMFSLITVVVVWGLILYEKFYGAGV